MVVTLHIRQNEISSLFIDRFVPKRELKFVLNNIIKKNK